MGDFPQELWVFGAFPLGHYLYPNTPAGMYDVERACDSVPQNLRGEQVEGDVASQGISVPGWSYVSWWDRQGDQRGNSHTGILARGTWERWQLVEEGRRRFPWAFRVPLGAWAERPAAPVTVADVIGGAAANALRDIAAAIGIPSTVDVLLHLPDLVERVRGLAERAETVRVVTADRDALQAEVDVRIADAVAAERAAAGAWIRACVPEGGGYARCIEHGDHIDDDAPPLPSLRMVMLLRDELHRQIATLTAERDRRINPVDHARAVLAAFKDGEDDVKAAYAMEQANGWETTRAALLARVGADVLAEVER